ncbi:MAG: peptidase M61, partial [Gammaproteobacteria bacterium]|nr:peptidase M61 [Gammaproteobacteria bacterium]
MRSEQQIKYTIQASSPEAHLFTIDCHISQPDPVGQLVSLPAWIPGSYMIRDFAKNIIRMNAATLNGKTLAVTRVNKSTWKIEACNEAITINYEVYAWDLSVRMAHLDTTHAFFNGSSVFIEVNGQADLPCLVEILCPEGNQYKDWRVATSMTRATARAYGFGGYVAQNYDELIDHPVEMGNFTLASFEAAGIPHDIVVTGRHQADMERLCNDLKKICETHIEMFGDLPPIDRYVFLVMAVGNGYGGLEHRSSTSLLCSRNDLPSKQQPRITEAYRTFLGLCSHEYFHTWNVKRIKPRAFIPYNLSKETHTRQLWAFEGITSYYDDLCLVRSGLIDINSYLELLGQNATRVWRGKGRFKQSVTDSSFDAWSKFYQQDENAPNAIVSYYTKGAVIALALDMTLRQYSNNTTSLDDLMRLLWQDYGKTAVGLDETEIEKLASDLVDFDLSDFFKRYLYSTEDIPLTELLAFTGIDFTLRVATGPD